MSTTSIPNEFTIERTFDAPRETIWRAWTDPTIAARWWHPEGVTTPPESVKIDLRESGGYEYLMIDPEGGQWPTAGSYLEVREPERLRFTWGKPGDAAAPVITVDLAEDGERTRMRFHLDGIGDDRGKHEHGVYDGWQSAFDVLDAQMLASR